MRQTSYQDMHCSIARSLDVVGDWWSPLIIRDLYLGVNRFDDLVENLGISRNLLTTRLSSLAENGVVTKVAYQERPTRYEYRLTAAGLEIVPILMALMAWGDRWISDGPPMIIVDDETGSPIVPTVYNPATGRPLDPMRVRTVPGPGGAMAPGTTVIARRFMTGVPVGPTGAPAEPPPGAPER